MPTINVIALSEPRCVYDGADTALPVQKRRFALLAYLAIERSAPRTRIVALFYPEIDEARAARRLTQSIYSIRQVFGNDCIETRGGELRACESLVSDACDFGTLADRGEYELAFGLYRRPFLDGFYLSDACDWERWVERKRAVLARTFAQAARLSISRFIERGNYPAAVACSSRWLELDEDNLEAHRLFMTALARSGRGEDALCHYQGWERALREHQGDVPCEQMRTFLEGLRQTIAATPARNDQVRDERTSTMAPTTITIAAAPVQSVESQDTKGAPETSSGLRGIIRRALQQSIAAL
ncbi:MAG: AfsR/SARP family transcriptional regulator [Longimicrobiales bacterium]